MKKIVPRREFMGSVVAAASLIAGPVPSCAEEQIKIRDLYRTDTEFSPRAIALEGRRIVIPGFMAPPLKPDASFFVLTRRPMSVCPFCDSAVDWPADIVLVLMREQQEWIYFNRPILARGVLELGVAVDEATGFVSKVRLVDAHYELVG